MISQFFNPESIAVIGASENPEKVGFALMNNLIEFHGKIIPINPNHDLLWGLWSYDSVLRYRGKIDMAVIAIPSKFVAETLKECGKKKIKHIVIISAGFSEIGKIKREENLVQIAKKYNMTLIGPNCFGVYNPYNKLNTTFALSEPKKGNIAFISQSGALWSYIADFSLDNNFGFSKFVSLGNMAGADFSDFIEYFNNDRKTKSIVIYMEKLEKGRRFIEVCKKSRKKIFVVKAGSSKKGSEAAISHTGSLATDYAIYKGAFNQAGVILCDSLLEAISKIRKNKILKVKRKKTRLGKKIGIVTNAGGAGALIADYISEKGYDIRKLTDILGTATSKEYLREMNKLKKAVDSLVVIITPQYMTNLEDISWVIKEFKKKTKKKVISCFLGARSTKGFGDFNTLEDFRKNLDFPIA